MRVDGQEFSFLTIDSFSMPGSNDILGLLKLIVILVFLVFLKKCEAQKRSYVMKLSACLITKNEERHIEKCINSFRAVVDEILVVDTGSVDKTVSIAESVGAEVLYYKWDDNFSNPRNFALEHASGDWVIFLDADEYFANGTEKNIRGILKRVSKNKRLNAVICKSLDIDKDDGNLINVLPMIRIFKKSRGIRYCGNIHENIRNNGEPMHAFLPTDGELVIHHTGYSTNIVKSKLERNLKLLLANMENGSADIMTLFYLSDCYLGLEKYDMAIKYAREYIDTGGVKLVGHNIKPYLNIIYSLMKIGTSSMDVIREIDEALKKFPDHPELFLLRGTARHSAGQYRLALADYKTSLQCHDSYKGLEINGMLGKLHEIYYSIGKIYVLMCNYPEALDWFVKSLKVRKDYSPAFYQLIKIIRCENDADIIILLRSIYDENSKADVQFLVQELAKAKLGKALLYYSNIWMKNYKKFGNDDIRAFLLLSNGKYDEALLCFGKLYSSHLLASAELFSVVSALLSSSARNVKLVRSFVSASFGKIIDAYYGLEQNIMFSKEDLSDYCNILRELILLDRLEETERFLSLKSLFDLDVSSTLGAVLMEFRVYHLALAQYHMALDCATKDYDVLHGKIGICLYKLGRYAEAMCNFNHAIEMGSKDNEIKYEYMAWIEQRQIETQNEEHPALFLQES